MFHIEIQYLSLNKILLLAIGLWPYQQSRLTQFQFIFFFTILMTGIIFQLTALFTTTLKYSSDLIITVLSSTSFFTILMIKYYTFRIKIKTVENLLIQLQNVCNELKDKNEIAIIEKYGYIAKSYTVVLTVTGICLIPLFIIFQSSTISYDVLPINATKRRMQIVTEYFVDQEKYFFLILLHINIAFCIGAIAMLAVGTMFIACFKLFCGMFTISSYRIERAIKINILQNNTLKNKILRSDDLICAVDIHRQAIEFPKRFLSKFGIMYFLLAQVFVISLCFNFAQIFQIVLSEQSAKKVVLPTIYATVNVLYLFISNSLGQNITDHNNYVFDTVYKVKWYLTPLYIQRLILFLLIKGTKNFTLSVGLFSPSLECFATLIKASVSYFTVILSTQ